MGNLLRKTLTDKEKQLIAEFKDCIEDLNFEYESYDATPRHEHAYSKEFILTAILRYKSILSDILKDRL